MTRKISLSKLTRAILLLCIAVGVLLHIVPYLYNRSLWIDEAMLASSICTRSFSELVATPLDWGQSAPIGWLFLIKAITTVFGTSKAVLRIWSLFCAYGVMLFIYMLLRGRVRKNCALLFVALFALTDLYIYYGNELKPYMSDNLCCLIVLFIWQKHRAGKLKLPSVALCYALLIWFSFPAVFFVAACMILEGLAVLTRLIKTRQPREFLNLAFCGIVLISFVAYYLLWLAPSSASAGDLKYWNLLKFPLIPTSRAKLDLMLQMLGSFIHFLPAVLGWLLFIFLGMFICMSVKRRRDSSGILLPSLLSFALVCIASFCGFYPIQDRLVQSYAVVLLAISANMCDALVEPYLPLTYPLFRERLLCFFYAILGIALVSVGSQGLQNLWHDHVVHPPYEIGAQMEYLDGHLTQEDTVYVESQLVPSFVYETGFPVSYQELRPLPLDPEEANQCLPSAPLRKGNVIYGQLLQDRYFKIPYNYDYAVDEAALREDIDLILENESVYIICARNAEMEEIIATLQEHGSVDLILYRYGSALCHFVKDAQKM